MSLGYAFRSAIPSLSHTTSCGYRTFSTRSNVPDHLLPLAFGTKACSAGDVPKVPQAW